MKSIAFCCCLCLGFLTLLSVTAFAGEVNVSAAASLKEVINELSDNFARKYPHVKFLKNFGGSGVLAKQVENGAPAHIFISANQEWMDYLKARKLVSPSTIGALAFNTLVFAGTADKKIQSMQDLPRLAKVAIGSPKSVPAGEYAVDAMKKAGVDRLVEKKLIMAKDVRDCLMFAEREEVDGAFVYRTDALQAKKVRILFTVPQDLYPRVKYPMALTVAGAQNRDAEAFFRYLHTGEAKAVLARHGFALK